MPIEFLLPKPFELDIKDIIERQFIKMIRKHNQVSSVISGLISAISLIVMFCFIPYARANHLFAKEDREAILAVIYLVLIAVVFMSGGNCVSTWSTASEMPQLTNDFQVKQTSFYIAISYERIESLIKDYLYSKKIKSKLVFNYYNVYADIYDELSGDTTRYFIGQMENGQLIPIGNHNKYCKLATKSMLTAINSYALYIKKHHLESEFADSATLRFSTKYLGKDYKPMLVMTNKSGKVLHLKQDISNLPDNVICSNEIEEDENYAN